MVRIAHHYLQPVVNRGDAHKARRTDGESAAQRAKLPDSMIEQLTEIAKQKLDVAHFGELVPHQSAGRDFGTLRGDLAKDFKTRQAVQAFLPQVGLEDMRFVVDPNEAAASDELTSVISIPPSNPRGAVAPVEAEVLPGLVLSSQDLMRAQRAASSPYHSYVSKSGNSAPVSGIASVNSGSGNYSFYDNALAQYPQELQAFSDRIRSAMEMVVKFDSKDPNKIDPAKLNEIVGFDVSGMADEETGKIESGMQAQILLFLQNKLSERTTQMSNLVKSAGDLFQQLNGNLRVS